MAEEHNLTKPSIDDGLTTIKRMTDLDGDVLIGQFDNVSEEPHGIIRKISASGDSLCEKAVFNGVPVGLYRNISKNGSVTFMLLNEEGNILSSKHFDKDGTAQGNIFRVVKRA